MRQSPCTICIRDELLQDAGKSCAAPTGRGQRHHRAGEWRSVLLAIRRTDVRSSGRGRVWVAPYRHEPGRRALRGSGRCVAPPGARRRPAAPPPAAAPAPPTSHAHAAPTAAAAPLRVGERFSTADGGPAVHAAAAERRHRRVPLLPRRPGPARAGVPDRQPVPAEQRRRSCTTRSSSGSRRPTSRPPGSWTRATPATAGPASAAPASAATTRPARSATTGWPPGRPAASARTQTPAGTGYLLQPGAQLVMQVHYNLLNAAAPGRATGPASGSGWRPARRALTPLRTQLLPAPVELPCPGGATGGLCDRTLAVLDVMRPLRRRRPARPLPGSRCSAGRTAGRARPHPELRPPGHRARPRCTRWPGTCTCSARRITVQLNPGRPGARTLLDVDPYNFHDQRSVRAAAAGRRAGRRRAAGDLHPRREPAPARAARGAAALRGLGRRHHRRDVPRHRHQGLRARGPAPRDLHRRRGRVQLVGLGHAGRGQHVHRLRHRVRVDRADRAGPARRADAELEVLRGRREAAGLVRARTRPGRAARR